MLIKYFEKVFKIVIITKKFCLMTQLLTNLILEFLGKILKIILKHYFNSLTCKSY